MGAGFGKSDKLVDWQSYTLDLHKSSVERLLDHLGLLDNRSNRSLTLVGHN